MNIIMITKIAKIVAEAQDIYKGYQEAENKYDFIANELDHYIDIPNMTDEQEKEFFQAAEQVAENAVKMFKIFKG